MSVNDTDPDRIGERPADEVVDALVEDLRQGRLTEDELRRGLERAAESPLGRESQTPRDVLPHGLAAAPQGSASSSTHGGSELPVAVPSMYYGYPKQPTAAGEPIPSTATGGSSEPKAAGGSVKKRQRVWWVIAAVCVLVLVGAGVTGATWWSGRADRAYLSALRDAGLGGEFSSEANAVAAGHAVCGRLDGGAAARGQPVDLVAVKSYCPQYESGFKVLETKTIAGTFELRDTSTYSTGISSSGGSCQGSGGYSDIHQGTQVVVKGSSGATAGHAELGPGYGTSTLCTFTFSVTLTEGEDSYVVEVGKRGELQMTWAELTTTGIGLSLGD